MNEQMFDADAETESKTASESVTLVAQQQQLSQYESLVGSAGAWHEGHSARGQLSDAQLRLLEQRFADNVKSILVTLKPPDTAAARVCSPRASRSFSCAATSRHAQLRTFSYLYCFAFTVYCSN